MVNITGFSNVITDHAQINFTLLSQNLQSKALPFNEINISLGDKRFYFDDKTGRTWIPEQEYKSGSWGYLGGQSFIIKGSTRTGYGATKDILETEADPIFQTQRTGIEQFRFDIPNGKYEITLHFAELLSPAKTNELVYNLGSSAPPEEFKERVFSVYINNQLILNKLSNSQDLVPLHAFSSKHTISVNNNTGIVIDFNAIKGEAILNGIQLKKIW